MCQAHSPRDRICFSRRPRLARKRPLKMEYLWIALGSALGGVARYWLSGVVARRFGEAFPVGTLIVNVTGSFVIGFAAAVSDPAGRMLMSVSARRFIMAGLCGGYTTFS